MISMAAPKAAHGSEDTRRVQLALRLLLGRVTLMERTPQRHGRQRHGRAISFDLATGHARAT
jgi:hypothetical protein